jgi:enoyl-CoA hydratase/carnithine racemase
VLTEIRGPVGRITLNEPARLNPVTRDRIAELNAAAAAFSANDEIRVVVITGAGRGFCSGADLAAFKVGGRPDSQPASGSILNDGTGLWTLSAMRQPVIAMVNGPAIGFGFELALQADLRVASASAKFGVPFGRLGTVSDTGAGSWLLPRLVGWGKAAEIFYTGRHYSAADALAMGLVNNVVPDPDLEAFTSALASEIAKNSAWSLRTMKRMFFDGLEERRTEHVMQQFRLRNQGRDQPVASGADDFVGRFR